MLFLAFVVANFVSYFVFYFREYARACDDVSFVFVFLQRFANNFVQKQNKNINSFVSNAASEPHRHTNATMNFN